MRKLLLSLSVILLAITSCGNSNKKTNENSLPKVYMTSDISAEGLVKVYEALGVKPEGKVAVKISTGEPGGHHFLQPSLIKDLVRKVNGTIVECNTAYTGKRYTSEEHWQAVKDHGFLDIADVDIMDEKAEIKIPVHDTTHIKFNIVGANLQKYDYMINLAHFKGHAMGGFGGVLKNQSIGVASANGKAYIHTAGKTEKKEDMWENIYKTEQDHFLESMAAAAQSVHEYFDSGESIIYINVMNNLSVDCDCNAHPAEPLMKDIGILASKDPVALDQACLELVFAVVPEDGNDNQPLIERINSRHGTHIVDYSEQIGLGSKKYELVKID